MIFCTDEQNLIIYDESPIIYVDSRAGTGKTTTLVEFAKLRKSDTILYIAYNNSIKIEALGKFSEKVTIHTSHSLAYSIIGKLYADKIGDNIKVEDIFQHVSFFKEKNIHDLDNVTIAVSILKVLNHFCNSAENKLSDLNYSPFLINAAEEFWNKMIDKNNMECLITHDGYLKLYQLSNPTLDYDYIMVDEAQDSNEVMLDIINKQNTKKIFVGDPHQKIYGFRGALNVFNIKNDKAKRLYLTESFRFGQEIANVANRILSFKGEKRLIKGTDRDSIVGPIDKDMQYTVICRTNTYLFNKAIELSLENKKIHVIGGIESIYAKILDMLHLYHGKHNLIKNDYLKSLKSFGTIRFLAESVPEYRFMVKLIDKYGDNLYEHLNNIKQSMAGKKTADIILTTAHKSKGLEFISVEIADDFQDIEKAEEEEINILYVAVTRATHELQLNSNLGKLMNDLI